MFKSVMNILFSSIKFEFHNFFTFNTRDPNIFAMYNMFVKPLSALRLNLINKKK